MQIFQGRRKKNSGNLCAKQKSSINQFSQARSARGCASHSQCLSVVKTTSECVGEFMQRKTRAGYSRQRVGSFVAGNRIEAEGFQKRRKRGVYAYFVVCSSSQLSAYFLNRRKINCAKSKRGRVASKLLYRRFATNKTVFKWSQVMLEQLLKNVC